MLTGTLGVPQEFFAGGSPWSKVLLGGEQPLNEAGSCSWLGAIKQSDTDLCCIDKRCWHAG